MSLVLACCVCLLSAGCGSTESLDGLSSEVRSATLVIEKPQQIQSIKSVYESFQPAQTVTIAGKIYAESVSPFDKVESSFSLIELPRPGHNHEDPGDCPFCKRELRNAKFAIIKIVDSSGKTYQYPADKLLGLKKNQDVVVTGPVSLVGDTLILRTRSLHLLSQKDAEELSVAFHQKPSDRDDTQEPTQQKPMEGSASGNGEDSIAAPH